MTLKITGIAHLIGDDGAAERLLVIPNKTGINHTPLLLTDKTYFVSKAVSLLGRDKGDFRYRDFPAGLEIDLVGCGIL